MLISNAIPFPYTHSIAVLLELLEGIGVEIPEEIKNAAILTSYAVTTRYPGEYEPIDDDEYNQALALTIKTYQWIEQLLTQKD